MSRKATNMQKVWIGILGILMIGTICYYAAVLEKNTLNTCNVIISCIMLLAAVELIYRQISIEDARKRIRTVLSFAVFLIAPLLMVGFIWNYTYTLYNSITFIQNALLIYILEGVLFVILFRIKPVMYISIFLNWFLFLGDEVVLVLRKTPLVPNDILGINTAMSVAGNYKFTVTSRLMLATAFSIFLVVLIHKLPLWNNLIQKKKLSEMIGFRVIILIITAVIVCYVSSFQRDQFQKDNFDVERMNENVGILLTFYLNSKEVMLKEPENYSKKKAKEYLNQYVDDTESEAASTPEPSKENPNVIIIMDEAFSDLGVLGELKLNQDPLKFCHSLEKDPNTISGKLNVSVWGGSTCNSEFEVLTGNTLEFLPYGSIPYMQYVTKNTDSICDYFHKLGYTNVAVHPYWGQCWRRDTIYKQIGFDKFIDAEQFDQEHDTKRTKNIAIHKGCDFGDLDYIREYISDKQSFKQIIHQFEIKEKGEKLFLFNVTMQNHGGYLYDGDNIEYTTRSKVYPYRTLSQYLSLIDKTDEALEYLVNYFKQVEEPTVIMFYGDHQPGLETDLYEKMFGRSYDCFTIGDYQKRYTVPYYIWANYPLKDVPSHEQVSTNYLSAIMKEAAGMPMDSWDNFRKAVRAKYPVLTSRLIVNANGERFSRGTVEDEIFGQYATIQYYRMKE
ncbi:LTA synthase family protein [[Clostridium] polysaccharolyticum]|uniref:Phosphoglycerol transferase MdoB n=1 Tax=[Clostridium] polysaccharolyticum TaxID=29364 RepID=A0A1I0AYS1_9FIRM|nr:LTA synthase family protein [[Clostridium] polysaccharolyticum]SES99690.1 Phosphoglycerol transferase MdoB [[Clostridium] polysaccharolyticum]